MSKFHINKRGVPAVCKATKGNCPLGGSDTHFETLGDAQAHADKVNEASHGLLPSAIEISPKDYETRDIKLFLPYELALYISDEDLEIYKEHRTKFDKPWEHAKEDYELISSMEIDDDKFIANMNEKGIEISDYDELNEDEKKALLATVRDRSIRRTRNIMSFLTSDKNTSYKKDKTYEQINAKGSFDDLYYKFKLMNEVGWTRGTGHSRADENSKLNAVMDKKSIEIAEKITKGSQANQESRAYPDAGMIYGIQMLRHRGIDEKEIIDRSHNERVADMVYKEYGVKPRKTSGAVEFSQILQKDADAQGKDIHEMLKESLNWTE